MNVRNIIIALCAVIAAALMGCTDITYITNEAPRGLPPVSTDDASTTTGDAGVRARADAGLPGSDAAVAVGEALTVSLSIDTPPTMTLPYNCTGVPLAVFDFQSGDAPVTINGFVTHRVGVGSPADFSNVYLADRVTGARLTTGRSINATTSISTFYLYSGPVVLAPHAVWSVVLVGDVDAATSGGQHAFEITEADDVLTEGATPVYGIFPVHGNTFTVSSYSAPRLDVRRGTVASEVHVGDMGAEVANFTLGATGDVIDTLRINLLYAGSASMGTLTMRAAIVDAAHHPIAWLPTWWNEGSYGSFLVIGLDPDHMSIGTGGTVSISVFSDIGGSAGRTIKLYLEYPADVFAMINVAVSWSPAAVCISQNAIGGCSAPGQGFYDGEYHPEDPSRSAFSEVTIR